MLPFIMAQATIFALAWPLIALTCAYQGIREKTDSSLIIALGFVFLSIFVFVMD
jgi:hypothetical protein